MEFLPVRLSHVLSHSGVGAIVRGPDAFFVVQDTRNWTNRQGQPAGELIPYVERVRAALEISEELRAPPLARELKSGRVEGTCIPVTRFPFWMRCPDSKCGALYFKPWKDQATDRPCCQACTRKPHLEHVPWVMVHPNGYLADIPWRFLAHGKARTDKQRHCKLNVHLHLTEHGYGHRRLRCDDCGASTEFRESDWLSYGMVGMQPWTRDEVAPGDGDQELARIVTINSTQVYSPLTRTALVVPPESRVRKGTVVDRLYRRSSDRDAIDKARHGLKRRSVLQTLASEYRCSPEDLEEANEDIANGYPLYGATFTPGQLLEDEYKSFLEVLPDQQDDEDLVTYDKTDDWNKLVDSVFSDNPDYLLGLKCVEHIIRIDRLQAVRVFMGFKRPVDQEVSEIVPPDLKGDSKWLPAIKLYGEGIFISFREENLRVWEEDLNVLARVEQLQPRFAQAGRDEPAQLSARFLVLHTLSHLLMRQIEAESGYPAASLTERIYCSTAADQPMAGILIYVAVPDIAGSLGGLAELAEPARLLPLLSHALDRSRWCSLDPVCREHEGQGPGLLNRAACHACALVPEPACEYSNTLLDRIFVKGDASISMPSLFGLRD